MSLNLGQTIARLKAGGTLTPAERAEISHLVEGLHSDDERLYTVARIVGLGMEPTPLLLTRLEGFLDLSTDEWGLHGVVLALCKDWGLTERYLGKLLHFSRIEVWNSHQSATTAALSALGDFLEARESRGRDVAQELLGFLDSAERMNELTRSSSVRSYVDAVWQSLDQWMRGREAKVNPTKYMAGSSDVIGLRRRLGPPK